MVNRLVAPARPRRWLGIRATSVVAAMVAIGAAAAVTSLALGQATRRTVLHEDLPSPRQQASLASVIGNGATGPQPNGVIGDSGPGQNPAAIVAGDKTLPEPADTKPTGKGEPVFGTSGMVTDRDTEMKPDLNTGADSTLHYTSVFNPDVLPFKRMSALDAVSSDYTLVVSNRQLVDVPIGGQSSNDRDRFWGNVVIELAPGKNVALPSVAPDMRILSAEVTPATKLTFLKDAADNFYVRGEVSGTFRLRFLVDANAGYFAPSLPTSRRYTVTQLAALAPAALRPAMPPSVVSQAKVTLRKLGIDPGFELGAAFNHLVSYFRAFAAKDRPPSSGDIYRDLCDSQAGVCRHRAFAFMVTANALGIPTRFVGNEAHAFVEVWFPERGWQRIDLGGAALRLEVDGMNDKTLHRPRAEDPFAKPKAYEENYTQLQGDISGINDRQLADRRRPPTDGLASGDVPGPAAGPASAGNGNGASDPAAPTAQDVAERITPDQSLPSSPADPKRKSPRLVVASVDANVYRGQALTVRGSIDVAGKPLPGRMIEIFLAPFGSQGKHAVSLGRAVSDASGNWQGQFPVPAEIEIKKHEVYASSPPDGTYNAALSP